MKLFFYCNVEESLCQCSGAIKMITVSIVFSFAIILIFFVIIGNTFYFLHRRVDGSAACDSQRLGINSRTYGTTGANYQHRTGWAGILFQYVVPGHLLQLKLR